MSLNTDAIEKIEFTTSYKATTKIGLSFEAISDPSKILELEQDIDGFVIKGSKNPFLLSGFIIQFMRSSQTRGWTPDSSYCKSGWKDSGNNSLHYKDTVRITIRQYLGKRHFFIRFCF
jgi:hypothetical protein